MNHEKETKREEVPVPTEQEVLAFLQGVGQAEGDPAQVIERVRQGLQERRYEDFDYLDLLYRLQGAAHNKADGYAEARVQARYVEACRRNGIDPKAQADVRLEAEEA